MVRQLAVEPLDAARFAPFGDVIDSAGDPTAMINNGLCARYSDRARLDFDARGRAGISVFEAQPYTLPHSLAMMERHPLGSQAFLPMTGVRYLVVVAEDDAGVPGRPVAFIAGAQQGVNIHRGVWHGVLTPLGAVAQFAVVDWIGEAANLHEHHFDTPWLVCEDT